jgi:uncharacterized membrane protein YoaK (UPF0700 family)
VLIDELLDEFLEEAQSCNAIVVLATEVQYLMQENGIVVSHVSSTSPDELNCMIRKLPRWVEIGGLLLTFIAGSVNAIGLLGFQHEAVSHLTGSASLLAMQIARVDVASSFHLLLVILSFLIGAMFSGFLIGNTALELGRRYSAALIAEASMLLIAMYLLMQGNSSGHFFASAACGLQNAMTSSYSGAVVRTTHITGLFTDIGTMLGTMLRGETADRRRLTLYLILICGFILGGVAGSLLFFRIAFLSLMLPATMAALLAVAHFFYWRRLLSQPDKVTEHL